METRVESNVEGKERRFPISDEAVEAVARSLYGEEDFDALDNGNQVKNAYRKRARSLLNLAADATRRGQGTRRV